MTTAQIELRQDPRWITVSTPLGEDKVVLESLTGHEGISEPFRFTLQLLSNDQSIEGADLLRKNVTVTVPLRGGGERYFNGDVNRLQFLGVDPQYGFAIYSVDVVPWLWFLSLTHDSRIFQQKTAVEIIEEIFGKYPGANFKTRCSGSHPTREYCVQYRESDFGFVCRLMEEEGIFYYFEHNDGEHMLILADESAGLAACPEESEFRVSIGGDVTDETIVRSFEWEYQLDSEKITLRDYNYESASTGAAGLEATSGPGDGQEYYDYHGRYGILAQGEDYAKLLLEERTAGLHVAQGDGTAASMTAGFQFALQEHPIAAANRKYLLTDVSHVGSVSGYRSDRAGSHYSNSFECIPADVVYRPPRKTPRPVVHGTQTAVVVGPSSSPDEEIYTDDQGRVKVQFHWDRLGKNDENSSCWMRVSSPWAGKGWGTISLPRIGHEVVVDFIEGDADRPIITGRVYNSENEAPYALPTEKTVSGTKSRSSTDGGAAHFNEIRMEDKKGSELLYLHAEKDKQVVVENDNTETVGHDESIEIGNDREKAVKHDEKISIANDQGTQIGGERKEYVDKDETITIGGNRTEEVGKDEKLKVGGSQDLAIGKNHIVSVGRKREVDIKTDDTLDVGKALRITAGDEIVIKTGKASIVMKKDGTIQIKGKDFKFDASGKISVKASQDIAMKGMQVKQN